MRPVARKKENLESLTQATITVAQDGTPMMDGRPVGKGGGPCPLEIPVGCAVPPTWPPPPDFFEQIIICFSRGKDSLVLLHRALATYPKDRLLVVTNLLGDEHEGMIEEVKAICAHLGLPLLFTWKNEKRCSQFGPEPPAEVMDLMLSLVRRNKARLDRNRAAVQAVDADGADGEDLEERSVWPGSQTPFCTSNGKSGPTDVVLANLERAWKMASTGRESAWPGNQAPFCTSEGKAQPTNKLVKAQRGSRLLILTGERRQESVSRSFKPEYSIRSASPTVPRLVLWRRMILDWTEQEVYSFLDQNRISLPEAYALGYSRYSCVLCVHKSMAEQTLSFTLEWRRAAARVALEEELHSPFWAYTYGEHQGWRAIWELTYGPWKGIPAEQPPIRPEALALIEGLRKCKRAA